MKSGLLMVLMVAIMFLVVMRMLLYPVEISIGSLTKFSSPFVNECVVQYGSRDAGVWGFKGIFTYLFRCWC